MKVALLISGLARNVEEGYETYFKHIIENYKTDVYLHYWEDGEWEKVLKIYKPKKYVCVEPFPFTKYKYGVESPEPIHNHLAKPIQPYDVHGNYISLPMFYGWQSVYSLVEGNYDCVIRTRYDLGWDTPIYLENFDLNKINVSITGTAHKNTLIVDDNIMVTNQSLSEKLLNDIFDFFTTYIKNKGVIYYPESNLTNILIEKE
jgi:hypothetical protein